MQDIREQIKQVIKNLYNIDFELDLTPAPANIDADYSTNAPLKLAKELHKSPMQIGEELKTEIEMSSFNKGTFQSAAARKLAREPRAEGSERSDPVLNVNISAPGFLNIVLSDDYLKSSINNLYNNFDQSISSNDFEGKTVICEYSDPNPFKVLHVGHLYTSIVGDSISRLYEYAGAKVVRANFGGDVGLHVAKTLYALKDKSIDDLQIDDISKGYIEGTALYEEDESARQGITKLNKEIYQINSENLHDTPLAKLYWKGRELSYDYFNDFYAKIGVHFDKYYPESTVAALGLAKVKEQLEKGVYETSNGATIFNGDKFGLHTRVFINQEGVPTYEAKDVGLIFTKWQDWHFDKSIVITGSEQLDYMKVVLKSIEQYAPDLVAKTTHLIHGLVKLPGGVKMSSRKGNFLKAVDVLDMVKEELEKEYHSTDEKISLAATKYAFLKYKMGGDIIFDPKESVKMTGNSGPYLLYSAVRAKKILDKIGAIRQQDHGENVLSSPERDLIKKLLEYKQVLQDSVSEIAPHKVATFLYELAQDFSRFYENCPVAGSPEEAERLKFVQVYLNTMAHGLNLLGISIPEEM